MKKLSIVGVGTKRFSQITLAALAQIQASQAICYIETEEATIKKYVPGEHHLVNLDPFYQSNQTDIENYKQMMKAIIKTLQSYEQVCFIVAGHPRLGVFLTRALEAWGNKNQVQVEVFEGISSFDVMANVLKLDILENGTSLIDINRALLYNQTINTQCDHFFYHVCSVANPIADFRGFFGGNRLDLLKEYLLKYYPKNHPIALVKAANSIDEASMILNYTVEQVDQLNKEINFSTTLYIPALKNHSIDLSILKIIQQQAGSHENLSL
ncbi:MAG: hypothetical protein H7328_05015 [Bdellovibrio sp.]|nr:hypothetical protein [Bdellovibrio sp.]